MCDSPGVSLLLRFDTWEIGLLASWRLSFCSWSQSIGVSLWIWSHRIGLRLWSTVLVHGHTVGGDGVLGMIVERLTQVVVALC